MSNYGKQCARATRWAAPDTFDTIGEITLRGSGELRNCYVLVKKNKHGEHAVKLLFHACASTSFDLPKSALALERGDVFVINVRPPPVESAIHLVSPVLLINLGSFPASFAINYISHSAEAEPRRRGKEFTRQMNVAVVHGAVFFISLPLFLFPPCGY